MSAVYRYKAKDKCGYSFKEVRGRQLEGVLRPHPYSKVTDSGEEIILTDEERKAWYKAYFKATEELGVKNTSEDEAVYKRVDEILKETGNYRFLQ